MNQLQIIALKLQCDMAVYTKMAFDLPVLIEWIGVLRSQSALHHLC